MEAVRTPDEQFVGLPGYDFAPHYADIPSGDGGTLRMHYLDEGPSDGPVVLLMHGEPSWCFLYRKMIPILVARGFRCIAPDLIGFGRSDKPVERDDYTYARHVEWVRSLVVDHLGLTDATFFGQDWGGLVGLRVVAENETRFARVAIGNTGLPTGDARITEAFLNWRKFSQETPNFDIGFIVSSAVVNPLPQEVLDAYNAPFPDDTYKAGARVFPTLVPITPDDPASAANRAAWEVFAKWEKPMIMLFSDSDPVTKGSDRLFLEKVPGTKGQAHKTIEQAGHFLQEDKGEELATAVADFIAAN
ncbi:MAG TPA: haloalkane dehalogenase [Mycobacteriales bacterium]|nr:haloalkane dehalogenase [Mycobacteriales bacterium]HVX70972.1 haloalkane dehalogenase [Mycobacteriales bacterium]